MGTDSNLKIYNEDNNSEFAKLISQDLDSNIIKDNTIVTGTVEKIDDKYVHVFIKGAKSSGIVDINEVPHAELDTLEVGKDLEVYCERTEDKNGNIVLSIEKARRAKSWETIKLAYENKENVSGMIRNTVKGGLVCEIMGVMAFVPNSQLDTKPVKNVSEYMNKPLQFRIIKIDEVRYNLIASRRQIIEEENNKNKEKIIKKYKVGDIVEGKIKAAMSYGYFVSIENLDCLLHASEIHHIKITNLSDMYSVGETVRVKILEIDESNMRMSLSVKAMLPDPFETIKNKFQIGNEYEVKIIKLTEFGAFAELSENIVGLIHTSEISHTQKNVNPKSIFKINDIVRVKLKEVDLEKRKVGLSYKDCIPNPADEFIAKYPIGSTVKDATVQSVKEFGIFAKPEGTEVDVFIHFKQYSFKESSKELENVKKGDKISFVVLEPKDGKLSGSRRATLDDPFDFFKDKKIGDVISVRVREVLDNGLKVDCGKFDTLIRKNELAKDKQDCRPQRWQAGDTLDSQIIELDVAKRKVKLSVKKLEEAQEAEALERFGNTASGAVLGDILGSALEKKAEKDKK